MKEVTRVNIQPDEIPAEVLKKHFNAIHIYADVEENKVFLNVCEKEVGRLGQKRFPIATQRWRVFDDDALLVKGPFFHKKRGLADCIRMSRVW